MPILIKPNLNCNIHCVYCYEKEYRASHECSTYDLGKVLKAMEEQHALTKSHLALHGGEPLMIPKMDLEKILAKSVELSGGSSIQTNGTLIDGEHIELFRKYKTAVGISLDGPGELCKYRMKANEANKIMAFIRQYAREFRISVIAVVSRANAGNAELLNSFKSWVSELSYLGVGGRLNPCGGDIGASWELKTDEISEVMMDLAKFNLEKGYRWSPFTDIALRVRNEPAVCIFMGCDPYHTDSATVILGDGSITNCMRTVKDDIVPRHPQKYNTRDEILQEIPQEYGGCRECEYFYACRGGCPSMAIDNDWRNRTYFCPTYKRLFQYYENIRKSIGLHKSKPTDRRQNKDRPGHVDNHKNTPHIDSRQHTDEVRRI